MKIVYCITSISNIGGISKITIDKSNYLSSLGHDVTIVTTEDQDNDITHEIDERVTVLNLKLGFSALCKKNMLFRSFSYLNTMANYKKALEGYLSKNEADVIVDTCGFTINFLSKIKGRAKIIFESHNHYYAREISLSSRMPDSIRRKALLLFIKLSRLYNERKLKLFDKIVVLTEAEKEFWNNFNNVLVIGNYISKHSVNKSTLQKKRVITAGRLTEMKGVRSLVSLWKSLPSEFSEWELVIFGSGEQEDKILNMIKEPSSNNNIYLFSPTPRIIEEFSKSSIFATMSQLESFGMTIIEAKSVGLPVVAYNCPTGPKSLIEHSKDGFLVEVGDIDIFRSCLVKLMSSEEMLNNMSDEAFASIKNFTEESIMKKWLKLIEN
ncbi:glycosyltransferase family 4 protein [Vibrio fluvialis]|nr:glycosyltransferase family 4 protein [Vibrio fluvialis]